MTCFTEIPLILKYLIVAYIRKSKRVASQESEYLNEKHDISVKFVKQWSAMLTNIGNYKLSAGIVSAEIPLLNSTG